MGLFHNHMIASRRSRAGVRLALPRFLGPPPIPGGSVGEADGGGLFTVQTCPLRRDAPPPPGQSGGAAKAVAQEFLKFTKGAQKAVELVNFCHFKRSHRTHEKAPREPFGPAGLVKSDRLRGLR